jgi:putative transposase
MATREVRGQSEIFGDESEIFGDASFRIWQGRFGAVPMDEPHLANAVRYVSLNPVRARLVIRPIDWPWSSVRAHLAGADDGLVKVAPVLERTGDFATLLAARSDDEQAWRALRQSETSGRPIGDAAWIAMLEACTGRRLATQKRGPKPAARAS